MKPVRFVFEQSGDWRSLVAGRGASALAWLAWVLLAAALAGGLSGVWQAWRAEQELSDAVAALHAAQSRAMQRGPRDPAARTPLGAEQRRSWNQLTRQLNTPWPLLLDTLETSMPDNVGLVSIEPDTRRGGVRLQVEAKTLDDVLAYAKQLDGLEPFGAVTLVKHETNERDTSRPVRLSLDAALQAPARGVR